MTPIRRIKKADERAVTTEMTKNSASFWRHLRSCDYAFREFRNKTILEKLEKSGYIRREKIGGNVFVSITDTGTYVAYLSGLVI